VIYKSEISHRRKTPKSKSDTGWLMTTEHVLGSGRLLLAVADAVVGGENTNQ
jgi:hypothetical protein